MSLGAQDWGIRASLKVEITSCPAVWMASAHIFPSSDPTSRLGQHSAGRCALLLR